MLDYKIFGVNRSLRQLEVKVRIYDGSYQLIEENNFVTGKLEKVSKYIRKPLFEGKVITFGGNPHPDEVHDFIRVELFKDKIGDKLAEQKELKNDYVIKAKETISL